MDSGNFVGYPSQFLSVPDEFGYCFTQAFQSTGLGLCAVIGVGLAQPDHFPVLGTGGILARTLADLDAVEDWVASNPTKPLVIDAKIASGSGSWWLAEAFKGH